MLRRHSSKGLDRRKSTSSAHIKHDSIDPEVAHRHARAAATLAYNRALERNSTDVGHRAGGHQQNSGSHDHQYVAQQASTTAAVEHGVRRQQSVRFAGPTAVQRRQSVGARASGHILQHKTSTATLRPIAMTTNAPVPAAYRPPSRSSSIGKASIGKAAAENFIATNAFDEYYTREDDIASTPSSYRRIRRSKSMLSPVKAPSIFYSNGSPDRQESIYIRDQSTLSNGRASQSNLSQIVLRAPKSMSFLRSNRSHTHSDKNDEAVQMARDRFFQETAQQRLREQPSFLFRSRAQQQESVKPFRKSVRSSSGGGYGLPIASANQDQPLKESSLRDAARKASKTIKSKLRRVFGRSKEEVVSIPNQQVEARESHVRKYNGDAKDDFPDIPHPDKASLSSVAARNPSLHAVNSNQQLRSYAGSVESMKSLKSTRSDDKSRVTSWTSTGVNTIASQPTRTQIERDQQRLSIINEVGTHIPSSSFRRQNLVGQFSVYPSVHKPSKSTGHIPTGPQAGQINSQRVYSALMKRLDENSPKTKLEAARKDSFENSPLPDCAPRSRTSAEVSPSSRAPATIRHVMPDDSSDGRSQISLNHDHRWVRADSIHSAKAENIFGHTGSHVHQWTTADPLREARMRNSDDVFSPKNSSPQRLSFRPTSVSSNKENMPPGDYPIDRTRFGIDTSALSRQDSTKTSYHTVPETFGLTPQELAIWNEPVVQGKGKIGLRESRSTFFGSSSVTITRATSPYRRALAEAELGSLANTIPTQVRSSAVSSAPYLGHSLSIAEKTINDQGSEIAYSESIYSRTTSGHQPVGPGSPMPLLTDNSNSPEIPPPITSTGDVVILDRTVYRPAKPTPDHRHETDSMGSSEWKKWMSSEVAKLERAKDVTTNPPHVNYALPTMPKSFHPGHVRESAQITDDDFEIAQAKAPQVKQPLGIAQQLHPNIQNSNALRPILKKRSTVSLVENMEQGNQSSSAIPVPPPPIPTRSPLRIMPSESSLRSAFNVPNSAGKVTVSGKNMLHKRNNSQATLRSVKSAKSATASIKSLETPAKLVKRNRGYLSNTNTPLPSPGSLLEAAINEQFGSTNSKSRTPRDSHLISSREALKLEKIKREETERIKEEADIYGINGAGLLGPIMGVSRRSNVINGKPESVAGGKRVSATEEDAQAMGSKMMVDLFLSSRRRRIAGGSEDSTGTRDRIASSKVFL